MASRNSYWPRDPSLPPLTEEEMVERDNSLDPILIESIQKVNELPMDAPRIELWSDDDNTLGPDYTTHLSGITDCVGSTDQPPSAPVEGGEAGLGNFISLYYQELPEPFAGRFHDDYPVHCCNNDLIIDHCHLLFLGPRGKESSSPHTSSQRNGH